MSAHRTQPRRGFTLMELMIVLSVLGILAAAGGALWLEGKVSAARIEAQLDLQRQASLAAEAIARDLRGAREVRPSQDGQEGIDVAASTGGVIHWRRNDHALVRFEDPPTPKRSEPWTAAKAIDAITVEPRGPRGFAVKVALSRELLPGRTVRAERMLTVERRAAP